MLHFLRNRVGLHEQLRVMKRDVLSGGAGTPALCSGGALSGGERQRVAIARAGHSADILLTDGTTGAWTV